MIKNILVLPAIQDHVEPVRIIKNKGYKVITCDNIPGNPAHRVADLSYNVDILDYQEVIKLAKKEDIDFVWGYSTDIGALAAARVSEELNLRGNSFSTVKAMTNKSIFRNFLKRNGFNTPDFIVVNTSINIGYEDIKMPVIVKPVDRASSKGVEVVASVQDLYKAINKAITYSFKGEVIVEEYIESEDEQLHGDAIVCDGKVVFLEVGDQFFSNEKENLGPIGTVMPSKQSLHIIKKLHNEIQSFVNKVGYEFGGINIEARVNIHREVYLIEVAPRSGGNFVPELLTYYAGIDIKEALFSALVLNKNIIPKYVTKPNTFQFIWRAKKSGVISEIDFLRDLDIQEILWSKHVGDNVSHKAGANNIIAILIIYGGSRAQVEDVFNNCEKYFNVEID